MHVGTILVLLGAILFAVGLFFSTHGEPRGRYFGAHAVLALAGVLTAVGVLLGAPALHA